MTQPNPYQQPPAPPAQTSVPAYQTEPIVLLSLLCCFPLGLVLLWTSPKFSQNARIALTAVLAVFVLLAGINGAVQDANRQRIAAETPTTTAAPIIVTQPVATMPMPTATQAPTRPAAPAQPSAIVVPVKTLLADYKNNEIRADGLYKNNIVQIAGVVGDVKRDVLGELYVTVGTGAMFELPIAQCFFDEGSAKRAATLNKGDRVTVRGRVDGLMMNVLIKDASFVQ